VSLQHHQAGFHTNKLVNNAGKVNKAKSFHMFIRLKMLLCSSVPVFCVVCAEAISD